MSRDVVQAGRRAGRLCKREGRVHDHARKQGVEATMLVVSEHAPEWADDRERL